jgi:hypothetical protein
MMDYSTHIEKDLPIGSGVTEAACKTLVKQRLCGWVCAGKIKGLKLFFITTCFGSVQGAMAAVLEEG